MKQYPSTYFFTNNASKKRSSVQKYIGLKEQIDRLYNGEHVRARKFHGKLSKNHICGRNKPVTASSNQILTECTNKYQVYGNIHGRRKCLKTDNVIDRKHIHTLKFSYMRKCHSRGFNKKLPTRMENYPHENKCLAANVNNYRLNFLNKQHKCRRISSKLIKHKREAIIKSNINASDPCISILYLSKMMSHSSKSIQSQQIKQNPRMTIPEILQYCYNRKSVVKVTQDDEVRFRPKKLEIERVNPIMALHRQKTIPNLHATLQSQSALYKKGIYIKSKPGNAIKNIYGMLPQDDILSKQYKEEYNWSKKNNTKYKHDSKIFLNTNDTYNDEDNIFNTGQIFKKYLNKFKLQKNKTNRSNVKQQIQNVQIMSFDDYKKPIIDFMKNKQFNFVKDKGNIKSSIKETISVREKKISFEDEPNNNPESEHCSSKHSIKKLNRVTTSAYKRKHCDFILSTAFDVEHEYAKSSSACIINPYVFKNNEKNIDTSPFFQTIYAFNVKVSSNRNKSNTSFLKSKSYESGLSKTNKFGLSKHIKKRSSSNAMKVADIKMPKYKGYVSLPRVKSLPEPKKAAISSMKFEHYLKSRDNSYPSQNMRSSFDFHTQILKNKGQNRRNHKQIALSQSIYTAKKINKRVACAKGGVKGIYIQYKGTKLKTKHSYTKPSALQNKIINANVQNKKKNKSTRYNNLVADMVTHKDKKLNTDKTRSYKDNLSTIGHEKYYNVSPKKLNINSRKSFPHFLNHKPSFIKTRASKSKAFLAYVSNLNNNPKTLDDSTVKMMTLPNRVNVNTKSNAINEAILKLPHKTSLPTNRDVMINNKEVRFSKFLNYLPYSRYGTLKPHEKRYGKAPLLRRCFYVLGLKNKNKYSDHKKKNRKSIANNSHDFDENTRKQKYKKMKNKHKQISNVNYLKHKLVPVNVITKQVSKGNSAKKHLKKRLMGKNNSRNLSYMSSLNKIFLTLIPHKADYRGRRPKEHGMRHRRKGNNNLKGNHGKDYVHQHCKVNNKSISSSSNDVKRNLKRLKCYHAKTRNFNTRKQRDQDYTKCDNSLQLDRNNTFKTMHTLINKSKSKQMPNVTDLSEGDNNTGRKKDNKFWEENHSKAYKPLSTYLDNSVHNAPFRVKKKHDIFSENIQSKNYAIKYVPSTSRTQYKAQAGHSIFRRCISNFGTKRHCIEPRISSSKTASILSSAKNTKSRPNNKELPLDNKATESLMLKVSNKSNYSGFKDDKPDYTSSTGNIFSIGPSIPDTRVRIKKPNSKQKTCVESPSLITTCESLICPNRKRDPVSKWKSMINFTKASFINTIKKLVKPMSKQKRKEQDSCYKKQEQDSCYKEKEQDCAKTNIVKLEIKKKRHSRSRKAKCQIGDKQQNMKARCQPTIAEESLPNEPTSKSSKCLKNSVCNLLNLKCKKDEGRVKLTINPKPDTECSIAPLLKKVKYCTQSNKTLNAATKAALAELRANDPTLPMSVKDPLLKLIVDKNTMNILNRDQIVYGLGSRRNESAAVKQGRLALRNKLITAPIMDLVINKDDAKIISADTNTTRGIKFKKDICHGYVWAGTKNRKESQYKGCLKSSGQSQSGKKKRLPCIYQCPECVRMRGAQKDRTKVFREPKTAGMVAVERVLDSISNTMLGWVGRSHCVCGTPVCKRERKKIEQERRRQRIKIKPCTCGSYECELAMAKKYHKHKLKRGKRKFKALKQKRIEKLKERQKTHLENALAKEKDKLVTMDKADLQKQYAKEDAWAIKRRQKKEKEALKRVEKFKDANDFFLLTESVIDIGKLGICVVFKLLKSSISAITNPKLTIRRLRIAARDPNRALYRMSQSCKGSEASAIIKRMHRRGRVMKTVVFFKTALESNPVTNYFLHIRDPQKRLRKIKKQRDPLDYECSLYMGSLRKRPCLWVYYLCPWFYPHCVSLVGIWRQFTDVLLFILAVGVWSPCILCTELCRALMCCCLCSA